MNKKNIAFKAEKRKTMKKLLLLALMMILPLMGCEKEEEDCKCDECPCEQIRDAEVEDLEGGDQDVSGGEEPELPVEGGQMEEEPDEEPVEECECSGSEGCAC